jgi:hypothetical protein
MFSGLFAEYRERSAQRLSTDIKRQVFKKINSHIMEKLTRGRRHMKNRKPFSMEQLEEFLDMYFDEIQEAAYVIAEEMRKKNMTFVSMEYIEEFIDFNYDAKHRSDVVFGLN